MRIAFVTQEFPPDLGGIQVAVKQLAHGMVLDGHSVEVFAHSTPQASAGQTWSDGVLVHRFTVPIGGHDFPVSPALFVELRRRHADFEIVHAHNYHALPALGAAVARMRPLVFSPHYHGGGHSRLARLAHLVYRPAGAHVLRASAQIACASNAEAARLRRDFPRLTTPIAVVPLGVDARGFREAKPFSGSVRPILAAGRMEHYKQLDRVIHATAFLPPDTALVLLGDGPARLSLERLAEGLGLASRVHFPGAVPDDLVRRWYRSAKAFVTMSRHEAFGLTVIEALAAGSPVVASDIPAHRETANHQPSGAVHLVPVDAEPDVIAKAIIAAASDGLPAGIRVSSWSEVVQQVLRLYATVLSRAQS